MLICARKASVVKHLHHRLIAGERLGELLQEKTMKALLARLVKDEQGTETLEWGLVCGLIVVGAIAAITLIGPKVTKMWNDLNAKVP